MTTAKIVSLGAKVSVGLCTFLSGPSDLPSWTSVTRTDEAGAAAGGAVASTAGGGGAAVSAFLQAARGTASARTAKVRVFGNRLDMTFSFTIAINPGSSNSSLAES